MNSKQRVKNIKKNFNLPVMKHVCGNNWDLMDMFVGIGYDCYQSIQESAGMDIGKLKNNYGKKICLWGGIPCESLTRGANEDIKKSVKRAIETCAPGGGFILGTSHSIAVGSNYDSFMVMLEEIDKLRNFY